MTVGTSKRYCPWCGELYEPDGAYCSACGRLVGENYQEISESTTDDFPGDWKSKVVSYGTVIGIAAVLYTLFVWTPWEIGKPEIRQTPAHPCEGWTEWESEAPDMSAIFPIHWSLLDGEPLEKAEYRYWNDKVERTQRELADAPSAPYALTEYLDWTLRWLDSLRYMLAELNNNGGENLTSIEYGQLDYRADQMGIAWSDAILACPSGG